MPGAFTRTHWVVSTASTSCSAEGAPALGSLGWEGLDRRTMVSGMVRLNLESRALVLGGAQGIRQMERAGIKEPSETSGAERAGQADSSSGLLH